MAMDLYTGGYTKAPNGRALGVGHYTFDAETGVISHVGWATGIVNPSFLAVTADGRNVYAVAEGEGAGAVVSYSRDSVTGELTELGRQSTEGQGPCYVSVDHSGRYALVANYGSGSVAALPIQADGSLGEATGAVQQEGTSVNAQRQEGPHAHMILSSPDGRFVFAADLGADRVFGYRLDLESGALIPVSEAGGVSEPGAGPRHFAFSPDASTVYVINELGSTLTRNAYEAESGTFTPLQTVPTLPEEYEGSSSCAHVAVSPDGRFVYGSNRGHDTIAVWAVGDEGVLTLVERVTAGGKTPRNFALSPDADGRWLLVATMDSDTVTVWPRDVSTGLPVGDGVAYDIPSCCCLVFV